MDGARSAPELHPRALALVASLPVLEVVSAAHILADLTLRLGKAVHEQAMACHHPTLPLTRFVMLLIEENEQLFQGSRAG